MSREKLMKVILCLAVFTLSVLCFEHCFAQDHQALRGIVDLHSNASDGIYSPRRIAELASQKGIQVLVFADCALRKWEYGFWPFGAWIKRRYQEKAVLSHPGAVKYLSDLNALKKDFPDMVIIPGLEANAFYYWKGNPLFRYFSLNDYYKKFIIVGLSDRDYQGMPIAGSSASRFNQYQAKAGIRPYQELIDYVNKKGGLIFWAHPEMGAADSFRGVEVYTASYTSDLFLSHSYSGFGVTFTDKAQALEPGDVWDKLLLEYLKGRRNAPAWIIGTLHYDGPRRRIEAVETLFWVNEASIEAVLGAMRMGRMYVRFNRGEQHLSLDEFKVERTQDNSARITIRGKMDEGLGLAKVTLIRNAEAIKEFEITDSAWEVLYDDEVKLDEKAYYRLKITNSQCIIFSNPVFI